MSVKTLFISFLALVFVTSTVGAAGNTPSGQTPGIPGQYIVILKDTTQDEDAVALEIARAHNAQILFTYHKVFKGFAAIIPEGRLAVIKKDPRVEFVSVDKEVSIAKTSSPNIQSQMLPTGVDRVNAEQTITHTDTGADVNVAIIDTGIDLNHPDLKANIVGGKNCSGGNPNNYSDGNGHGTHVAGTVAALDNGTGVVGVAPQAKLWSVRVLNNAGSGTWSSVICGIDFVTKNASTIKVANMSLGGSGTDSSSNPDCSNTANDALHTAICKSVKAGITYVVAAGNDGADLKNFVPAAYDEVIAVSALVDSDGKSCGGGSATSYGADDTFASFSNFATLPNDSSRLIGAPGVNIRSTWKGGGYNTISGTSMASPHVAGAAALYIKNNATATPASVRTALITAGEPANINFNGECSTGISSHTTNLSGKHPEPVLRADTL
jgi:subtilisin family serine protease